MHEITRLEQEITILQQKLQALKKKLDRARSEVSGPAPVTAKTADGPVTNDPLSQWPLHGNEYQRYGRQMIMPEIGLQGMYGAP